MILCQCGHQNRDTSIFCTSCGSQLSETPDPGVRLLVLNEGEQKEYLIAEAVQYVGRDPVNNIVLEDDQVSARHVKVTFEEAQYWVEDLRSTNGTFVNGVRIEKAIAIKNEDLLKIGRTIFKIIV